MLLHTPTSRAHELAADGRAADFTAALETLYGLSPEAPAVAAVDPLDDAASA